MHTCECHMTAFSYRHTFPQTLLSLTKQEISRTTDTKKLLASINVYVMYIVYISDVVGNDLQVLWTAAVPWY